MNRRTRPLTAPALHVDRDRKLADVCMRPLDVHGQGGGHAAKSLRADAGLVDEVERLRFELSYERIGVVRTDPAEAARFLGQGSSDITGAAKADAQDGRRAGIGAGVEDAFEDELLDGLHAVGRLEHAQEAYVFRPGALG